MSDRWYVAKRGSQGLKKFGPATLAQLQKLVAAGKLMPEDLVCREGMTEWKAASTLRPLFPKSVLDLPPLPDGITASPKASHDTSVVSPPSVRGVATGTGMPHWLWAVLATGAALGVLSCGGIVLIAFWGAERSQDHPPANPRELLIGAWELEPGPDGKRQTIKFYRDSVVEAQGPFQFRTDDRIRYEFIDDHTIAIKSLDTYRELVRWGVTFPSQDEIVLTINDGTPIRGRRLK